MHICSSLTASYLSNGSSISSTPCSGCQYCTHYCWLRCFHWLQFFTFTRIPSGLSWKWCHKLGMAHFTLGLWGKLYSYPVTCLFHWHSSDTRWDTPIFTSLIISHRTTTPASPRKTPRSSSYFPGWPYPSLCHSLGPIISSCGTCRFQLNTSCGPTKSSICRFTSTTDAAMIN